MTANLQLLLFLLAIVPAVHPEEQKAAHLQHSFVEEQPSGSKVADIKQLIRRQLYRADDFASCKFRAFDRQHLRYFHLDPSTGEIFLKTKVDRESLCSEVGTCCPEEPNNSPDCKLTLSIIVLDNSKPGSQVREIVRLELRVLDLNDNAPRWKSSQLTLEVPEHSQVGTRFPLPVAMDTDKAPENTTQRYELIRGLDKFRIGYLLRDSARKSAAGSLWLEIRTDLDREIAASHQAVLLAVDGGHPALTGSLTVNVSVADINDNPPRFSQFPRLIRVAENSPVSRKLVRLNATDEDASDRDRLRFRLGVAASQSVAEMFRVDARTGSVSAVRSLDYEQRASYDIPVTVSDGKHSADASLRLEVTNENDNPPKITLVSFASGGGGGGGGSGDFELPENAAVGTIVASLDVFDADDKDEPQAVACHVEPPTEFGILPLFKSSKRNFQVVSSKRFDRELTPAFTVKISCNDNGTPNRVDSAIMRISIRDENDNRPAFRQNPLIVRLPENKDPLPTFVLARMEATDPDAADNADLRYSLDAASRRHFEIDRGTAAIWARRSFDRELERQFNLTVFASDLGDLPDAEGRRLTATGTVVVNIEDVNDCRPEFSASHYAFAVEENAELRRHLGNVSASDCDAEERNRRVVYRMLGGPADAGPESQLAFNYFRVTQDGRVFTGNQPIDREFRDSFTFLVLADDQAGGRQTAHVTVSILDVNDNQPQWVFPSRDSQQVNVSVQQSIGHAVARLRTKDADYGANGSVVYNLAGQEPPLRLFSVTPEGEVLLSGRINPARDLGQLHRLRIAASDQGQPALSSEANLTIRIVEQPLDGSGIFGTAPRTADGNLAIILAMVVVTVIVSIFLIAAIVFLRCRTAGGSAGVVGSRSVGHDRVVRRLLPSSSSPQMIESASGAVGTATCVSTMGRKTCTVGGCRYSPASAAAAGGGYCGTGGTDEFLLAGGGRYSLRPDDRPYKVQLPLAPLRRQVRSAASPFEAGTAAAACHPAEDAESLDSGKGHSTDTARMDLMVNGGGATGSTGGCRPIRNGRTDSQQSCGDPKRLRYTTLLPADQLQSAAVSRTVAGSQQHQQVYQNLHESESANPAAAAAAADDDEDGTPDSDNEDNARDKACYTSLLLQQQPHLAYQRVQSPLPSQPSTFV